MSESIQAQTIQARQAQAYLLLNQEIQQCKTGQCEAAMQSFQQALIKGYGWGSR